MLLVVNCIEQKNRFFVNKYKSGFTFTNANATEKTENGQKYEEIGNVTKM